jgi:predicted peptidase
MARKKQTRLRSVALLAAVSSAGFAIRPARSMADEPPKTKPAVDRSGDDDMNPNLVLPSAPGDYRLKYKTHIGDREVDLPYALHFPPDYNKDLRAKYPMLVFFHGLGERGTDLNGVYALGPLPLLNSNPTLAASFPFIVLCPQCNTDVTWDTDYAFKAATKLIAQTIQKTRTDPDRVYATGLSMGGLGTWCVAEEAPDLFAAIAPTSAMAWHPEQAAQKLRYIAIWSVTGVNDQPRFIDGERAMNAALAHNEVPPRFTYFVDKGHEAWWPPFQSTGFYEWFLSHRRLTPAQRKKLDAQKTRPPTTQPLPTAPGHYLLTFPIMIGNQPLHMDYVLYLPRGYKPNAAPRPAMLFLPEQESIGPVYHGICVHGPDLELEKKPALQNNFPFVVISPRAPIDCDWNRPGVTKAVLALLDHVSQSISIDPDRICVSGLNAGADGAWKLAAEAPGRFAAIVPVVTNGQFSSLDDKAGIIKSLPGRMFVKPNDTAFVDRMDKTLKSTLEDWRVEKMPASASPTTDIPAYADHPLLTWLQQQHRNAAPLSAATAAK